MPKFDLDRLVGDLSSGRVKNAEILLDSAHGGRPEHIDLHVTFENRVGRKYSGLGGVDDFRQNFPWVQPGGRVKL